MLKMFLKGKSQASFVEYGYGQLEPNHLSAQRTGQIYAQLPADPSIEILEQGQFVKYDYEHGVVNFDAPYGEWMLVYNETKLYRENQMDCEFAMLKSDYVARVYSPAGGSQELYGPTRLLQGKREAYNAESGNFEDLEALSYVNKEGERVTPDYTVASKTWDYREMDNVNAYEDDDVNSRLFMKLRQAKEQLMPTDTTMVPRVYKTNVGDIITTNTINADLTGGEDLTPGANGILSTGVTDTTDMIWRVVKIYTMPDGQKGAKLMRIK